MCWDHTVNRHVICMETRPVDYEVYRSHMAANNARIRQWEYLFLSKGKKIIPVDLRHKYLYCKLTKYV